MQPHSINNWTLSFPRSRVLSRPPSLFSLFLTLSADIPGSGAVGSGSVVGSLLLSVPAGVPRAVESGSVVGSFLLPPCSCSSLALISLPFLIYSTCCCVGCPSLLLLSFSRPLSLSCSLFPLTPTRPRQMAAHPEPWFCSRFLPVKRKFFLACVA